MQTVICPDHQAKSADFVALNTKDRPVYRCRGGVGPPNMPHYFTVVEPAPTATPKAPRKKAAKSK